MARLIAKATGNAGTNTTWSPANTGTNASLLSTTSGTTALTTSNQDSATFTPANQASQYLAVRVSNRASGTPTNKMTVILRNSTGASDVWTFVINVSDIPACNTTDDQGGWLIFKAASAHTPNGTDNYVVRAKLDSTSTAVSLSTNNTTANWLRILGQTANATPAAADEFFVSGLWDSANPAVKTDVTVTWDITAATDFGPNSTSYRSATMNISKGGTVTWGTTASTDYLFRSSGYVVVYAEGTYSQGTSGSPMPTGSTGILEFDCAADNDFGLLVKKEGVCNIYGSPRTSGKNFSWTLLTADLASSGTTLTVQDDTGWKSGDSIAIASTTTTIGQSETATLNGDAGASSITVSAGVTNAHGGSASSKIQAEVVLLTRNQTVRSTNASFMTFVDVKETATFVAKWTEFTRMGSTGQRGVHLETTTGSATLQYCLHTAGENTPVTFDGTNNVTIDNGIWWNAFSASGSASLYINTSTTSTNWSVTNNVLIASSVGGSGAQILASSIAGTWSGNRLQGAAVGFSVNAGFSGTLTNHVIHGNGTGGGFNDNALICDSLTFSGGALWRNGTGGTGYAVDFTGGGQGLTFSGVTIFGNSQAGILLGQTVNLSMTDCVLAGDTTFAQPSGVKSGSGGVHVLGKIVSSTFGVTSGSYVEHSSSDISISAARTFVQLDLNNTKLASTTEIGSVTNMSATSYIGSQKHDQTAGAAKVWTPYGTLARDTSITTAAVKLTPTSATVKLDSAAMIPGNGFLVAVDNGQTPTISCKAQKDGSYNGNQPRLILKANPAVGITSDTVLDTLSVGANTEETLSGTTAAVTDAGVLAVVVDCDGTAGNAYAYTFSVTGAGASGLGTLTYWSYGTPAVELNSVTTGGGATAYPFMG